LAVQQSNTPEESALRRVLRRFCGQKRHKKTKPSVWRRFALRRVLVAPFAAKRCEKRKKVAKDKRKNFRFFVFEKNIYLCSEILFGAG
ncbi:MAG: hypothetical protein J1E04_01515, partial [Alistipes sp.]|nr:hypothetical protein [Alistipes sp.]